MPQYHASSCKAPAIATREYLIPSIIGLIPQSSPSQSNDRDLPKGATSSIFRAGSQPLSCIRAFGIVNSPFRYGGPWCCDTIWQVQVPRVCIIICLCPPLLVRDGLKSPERPSWLPAPYSSFGTCRALSHCPSLVLESAEIFTKSPAHTRTLVFLC